MESSWRDYKRDMADSVLQDILPRLLESRIETCRVNYKADKNKFPNAVILSKEARAVLFNAGLINTQSVKGRDTLNGGDLQLNIYNLYELPEGKNLEVKEKLSSSPGTFYMGRTNWLGKIKKRSLKGYEFKYSLGDLAQT